MLVFAAFGFAAQANSEGDVLLTSPNDAGMAPLAMVTGGFNIGTKATGDIMRDMWVGSDFDDDGNKEVMIASYGVSGRAFVYEITADNTATLFFDTGEMGGGYWSSTRHVAYGDLDGNGMQELLVSVNGSNDAAAGLWAFEYDTVGDSMRAPIQVLKQLVTEDRWYVENFTIGDVDQDGVEEIIVGNNGSSNAYDNFYIAQVDTGTSFAENNIITTIEFTHGKTSSTFPAGGSPYGGVIADMNGDGNNEVLFAPWDHGALFIVECDSADSYTAVNYIQTDLDRNDDFAFYDFVAADLDDDGRDEAYLSMYSGGRLYVTTCPVGTELSELTTADVHTIGAFGTSGGVCTQLGDLDMNGRMNIYASGGGSSITVHEYTGGDPTAAANWIKQTSLTSPGFSGVYGMRYAGDLDGDGYPEIYGANTGTVTNQAAAIEITYDSLDFALTFDNADDVGNWSHYEEANQYTVETWVADSTLRLSDSGLGFEVKRPVIATPGWIYKLSIDIKTVAWDGWDLDLSVQGLGNDAVVTSCITDSVWTTYSLLGIAESDSGYIRITGYADTYDDDTVYVDNVVWDDMYMDVYPSKDIAAAKDIALYDYVACTGLVSTVTCGAPIFMQDESAGIALYDWDFIDDGIVEEGDEILVIGKRAAYAGLEQIKSTNDNYIVLSKDNDIEPTLITVPDLESRDYQGMLVILDNVDTVDGFSWPDSGDYLNITLKDEADNEFVMFIDNDGPLDGGPVPGVWPLDLVGVVSEYDVTEVMPRYFADFHMNRDPGAFEILTPGNSVTITSMDNANIVNYDTGEDTVKALYMEWTEAIDLDLNDTVTYTLEFIENGPEEVMTAQDTFMYITLDEKRPWDMNGTYEYYIVANDLGDGETYSDTNTLVFDFQKPAEVQYADVVLLEGVPTMYVEFNLPVMAWLFNFRFVDWSDGGSVSDPTAMNFLNANTIMLTGTFVEDHQVSLVTNNVMTPGATFGVVDTSEAMTVYIPFSANHPEDMDGLIEGFEGTLSYFNQGLFATTVSGLATASTFAASDEEAYEGTKSGKFALLDDPAVDGGWFVRMWVKHPYTTTVKANSTILLMVKGSGKVDLALTIKDSGYERQMWNSVTLCENDWQVVAFDLANDPVEGWITGDGVITGETVTICDLHIQSSVDEDVVLYIDGLTERKVLSNVDITLNVMMNEWLRLGKFNLALDYVDVAGSFNGWDGLGDILGDLDGDTTYSVVVPMMPYSTQEFKFRINGSSDAATAEFPGSAPARELVVPTAAAEYTYWYNDDTLEVAIDGIPAEFTLHQNYPNPFNPVTTINFDLPNITDVSLVIYDITGRKVRTLVSNNNIEAGYKKIVWNGRDDFGNGVATGMYIYRLVAGDFVDVKKMTFLK